MKKIFIIGISGSGKTYLSNILSEKYDIEKFDLDDIFWEKKYSKKREVYECEKILNKKIKNKKSWIYEGIYTEWTEKIVKEADLIIWLNLNKNILTWRVLKRWWSRREKTGEKFSDVFSLIKFQRNYKKIRKGKERSSYTAHKELTKNYKNKLVIIKSPKELNIFLKNIK